MQRRQLIIGAVLLALIGAGLWSVRVIMQRHERTAIALTGVAPVPDLNRWPAELQQRIARESTAVRDTTSPLDPLGRLAELYWANGYGAEAEQALTALRRLDPANARWPYLAGDLRWRVGDLAGAEQAWQASVELDPSYAPVWFRLGELRLKRGANAPARECYVHAATADPGMIRYQYNIIYFDATYGGNREATLKQLTDLARVHPGIKEIHELLSGMLAERDAAGSARERRRADETELVLSTEDSWLDALYEFCFDSNRLMLRAVALRREGRLAEAEKLLVKVVALAQQQPANPLGWELLSDLYVKQQRPAEARATLEQAVAQFPDEPQMRLLLARFLCSEQQPEAAVKVMQQAVEHWPERGELHAALGLAWHDAGQFDAAVKALNEGLRLDPTLTEAQYQLGLSYIELNRTSEARAALAKALAMRPDYPEAMFALAAIELDSGDFAAAEANVFKIYALDPEEPNARHLVASWHLLKGMSELKAGNLAAAEQHYRAGLAVSPDFPLLLRESGRLAQKSGRWPDAVAAYEHYVRVKPADPAGYLSLGLALRESGREAETITVLQRGRTAAQQAGDQAGVDEFSRLLGR